MTESALHFHSRLSDSWCTCLSNVMVPARHSSSEVFPACMVQVVNPLSLFSLTGASWMSSLKRTGWRSPMPYSSSLSLTVPFSVRSNDLKLGNCLRELDSWGLHCGVRMPVGFDDASSVPLDDMPKVEASLRYRGRRVARLPAVIARPCSISLQMATSTVAQRKSGSLNSKTYASRTVTAILALDDRH
jgi:hypothetical protein